MYRWSEGFRPLRPFDSLFLGIPDCENAYEIRVSRDAVGHSQGSLVIGPSSFGFRLR